jgi:hypothetical protein
MCEQIELYFESFTDLCQFIDNQLEQFLDRQVNANSKFFHTTSMKYIMNNFINFMKKYKLSYRWIDAHENMPYFVKYTFNSFHEENYATIANKLIECEFPKLCKKKDLRKKLIRTVLNIGNDFNSTYYEIDELFMILKILNEVKYCG